MADRGANHMQAEIDAGRALARAVKKYLEKLRAETAPWDMDARESIGGAHREMLGALMDYDARFLAPLEKSKVAFVCPLGACGHSGVIVTGLTCECKCHRGGVRT